jgi:hypothetical protein
VGKGWGGRSLRPGVHDGSELDHGVEAEECRCKNRRGNERRSCRVLTEVVFWTDPLQVVVRIPGELVLERPAVLPSHHPAHPDQTSASRTADYPRRNLRMPPNCRRRRGCCCC